MGTNNEGEKQPLFIFKGIYVWDKWIRPHKEFTGIFSALTTLRWIEKNTFLKYLEQLIGTVENKNHIVRIFDGHLLNITLLLIQ